MVSEPLSGTDTDHGIRESSGEKGSVGFSRQRKAGWSQRLKRGAAVKKRVKLAPIERPGIFNAAPEEHLTQWTEEDYKTAFELFDKDKDGTITMDEVTRVYESLGVVPSKEDVQALIDEIDMDGDGYISLDEFKSMMKRLIKNNEDEEQKFLRETFKEFDVDGNGLIGSSDLIYIFRKLGDYDITEREVEAMIRDANPISTRGVNYQEFRSVIKGR